MITSLKRLCHNYTVYCKCPAILFGLYGFTILVTVYPFEAYKNKECFIADNIIEYLKDAA